MPSTSNRQASIDSRRIALEREISIRVPRFDTFVTEYSTNISTTGMFIISENPHAPGTTFTFEFSVADDWKLIRGKAQVVWTRYLNEDKERPAGMGIRFVELDPQSRRLIRWIVEKHVREGGKPFELDELRTVVDEVLEEVIVSDQEPAAAAAIPASTIPASTIPASRGSAARSRPTAKRPPVRKSRSTDRRILPLVATAAVVVLGLVCLFWLTEWIPDRNADSVAFSEVAEVDAAGFSNAKDPAATVRDAGEGSSPPGHGGGSVPGSREDPTTARSDVEDAFEARGLGSPPLGSAYSSVRQTLVSWSDAWSAQNVEGYLSAYSRDYQPDGSSRAAWEALRRQRLTAPEYIKVSISRLDTVRLRDDLVKATLFQSYRSNGFSDTVEKVFELVWEDGAWKILSERTL